MSISPIGALICLCLFVLGRRFQAPIIVGLFASLAFGSTAMMTLGSLGGSSPLIYTAFIGVLLLSTAMRRQIWQDISFVLARIPAVSVALALAAYAAVGAILFPRFFAGQTGVFVPSRVLGGIFEVPLAPVSANISQTGYFILGVLTFVAFCLVLVRSDRIEAIRKGFFVWCIFHASMGGIDLIGKLAGLGDVLSPIRTASYAMLTDVEQAGFFRIAGAYSEASAFGGITLACLAFTITYWRNTKSPRVFLLAVVLLVLLLLSTSSTAYAGGLILSIPLAISVGRAVFTGRLSSVDLILIALAAFSAVSVLAIYLYDPSFFDPFVHLLDTALISKSSSGSAHERAYWNYKSIQSFFDTSGLGIGIGSSRASSWAIAVLSQLGIVGTAMTAFLAATILRGVGSAEASYPVEKRAFVRSVRAAAVASMVSGSLASGSADPGVLFFVALAVITVCRERALGGAAAATASPHLSSATARGARGEQGVFVYE